MLRWIGTGACTATSLTKLNIFYNYIGEEGLVLAQVILAQTVAIPLCLMASHGISCFPSRSAKPLKFQVLVILGADEDDVCELLKTDVRPRMFGFR